MTITELHRRMAEVLDGCEGDAAKAETGNAAAGRRYRKALQVLKRTAQEARKASLAKGE